MLYSTTCAYAIRAMSRLTALEPPGYVRIQEVCEGTDLPAHFVAKIFRDLVRAGLLISAKGRGGGFALAKPPADIRLIDIVESVDGLKQYQRCVSGLAQCDDTQPCSQHDRFKQTRRQILEYLQSTSLDDMAAALQKKLENLGLPLVVSTNGKPIPE